MSCPEVSTIKKQVRLSKNAHKIFALLQQECLPLSAYEILLKLLPEGNHAPATVYRSLDALIRVGLLNFFLIS